LVAVFIALLVVVLRVVLLVVVVARLDAFGSSGDWFGFVQVTHAHPIANGSDKGPQERVVDVDCARPVVIHLVVCETPSTKDVPSPTVKTPL
jgi:hypothetical protein